MKSRSIWLSSKVNYVKHNRFYALWGPRTLNKPAQKPPELTLGANTPEPCWRLTSIPSGPAQNEREGLCTVMNTPITFLKWNQKLNGTKDGGNNSDVHLVWKGTQHLKHHRFLIGSINLVTHRNFCFKKKSEKQYWWLKICPGSWLNRIQFQIWNFSCAGGLGQGWWEPKDWQGCGV